MPNEERITKTTAPTSFGTYGATGKVTWSTEKHINRTRSWSNSSFRTAKQRAQQILTYGFLPTLSYEDDLQHVVNSKLVTASGQLNSDPRSTFLWRFLPAVARIACSTLDSDAVYAETQALAKLQSKLSGVGVSVPLTIADAGKTADMIMGAALRLATSYRHVRHGNFKAAAKALGLNKTPKRVGRYRSVDDNWLEYRYGWRLVVNDITSYMKQIHNMLTTQPVVHRETAMFESTSRKISTTPDYKGTGSFSEIFKYTKNGITTRYVMATAGYVYSLESVSLSTGQQLGLLNPLAVAWDLIPASFMVDWAVNVSSVLEGITAFQGKTFLDGWTCRSVQTTRQEYWTNIRKGTSVYSLNAGLSFFSPEVVERRFTRTRLNSFRPDSLRLDFSASFQNGIDGLALIKQIFGPKRS